MLSIYYRYPIANWACYWSCKRILLNVDKNDCFQLTGYLFNFVTSYLWLGGNVRWESWGRDDFILLDIQTQIWKVEDKNRREFSFHKVELFCCKWHGFLNILKKKKVPLKATSKCKYFLCWEKMKHIKINISLF